MILRLFPNSVGVIRYGSFSKRNKYGSIGTHCFATRKGYILGDSYEIEREDDKYYYIIGDIKLYKPLYLEFEADERRYNEVIYNHEIKIPKSLSLIRYNKIKNLKNESI